jgi:hypothetical protein
MGPAAAMMAVVFPGETAVQHLEKTGHQVFEWSLEKDLAVSEAFFGRRVVGSDPYVGVLVCRKCSTRVWNR